MRACFALCCPHVACTALLLLCLRPAASVPFLVTLLSRGELTLLFSCLYALYLWHPWLDAPTVEEAHLRPLRLTVEYDGTAFYGYQSQPAVRNVQDVLEAAVTRLCGETRRTVAASRTDRGVHARGQVVLVRTACPLPCSEFMASLNSRYSAADGAVHGGGGTCVWSR